MTQKPPPVNTGGGFANCGPFPGGRSHGRTADQRCLEKGDSLRRSRLFMGSRRPEQRRQTAISIEKGISFLIIVKIFTKSNSKYLYYANILKKVLVRNMPSYMQRLRNLREDHDKTQEQIAQVLGTSQTMYARYEREASELPIRHLITLCRYYRVSADFVLGLEPLDHRDGGNAKEKK